MKLTKSKIDKLIKQYDLYYIGDDKFCKRSGGLGTYYLNEDDYLCWYDIFTGDEGIIEKVKWIKGDE